MGENEQDGKMKMGVIKGELAGFKDGKYTRGISPANVYVKIVVFDGKKKREYSPYEEKDLKHLIEKYPSIYELLHAEGALNVHPVDKGGEFKMHVPLGSWGYIVAAHVENKDFDHTKKNGDNGKGSRDIIQAQDFPADTHTLEGIVVPVEDKLWSIPKGVKKDDPKTDISKVPPGIISDDDYDKIRKYIEEHMEEIDKEEE